MSQAGSRQSSTIPQLQLIADASSSPDEGPLFTGNSPMGAQAVALYRYCRVMVAITAYEDPIDIQARINERMRWTVGMHRELVRLTMFTGIDY